MQGFAARGGTVRERPLVLDLGPPFGSNIQFFATRGLRVRVADLYASLGPIKWRADGERFTAELTAALEPPPAPAEDRAALVLVWDLLNYLTLANVRAVATALAAWSRPDARLIALVATLKEQPASPVPFRIADPETVQYDLAVPLAPSPRHKPADLERALAPFTVEGSWILRNGFREYLFAQRG